jgi:hypothetical protein
MGYHGMKKGKKMPSIELDGHSEAQFALVDGKIVRVEKVETGGIAQIPTRPPFEVERRLSD